MNEQTIQLTYFLKELPPERFFLALLAIALVAYFIYAKKQE
jgi:hypothetical protein